MLPDHTLPEHRTLLPDTLLMDIYLLAITTRQIVSDVMQASKVSPPWSSCRLADCPSAQPIWTAPTCCPLVSRGIIHAGTSHAWLTACTEHGECPYQWGLTL